MWEWGPNHSYELETRAHVSNDSSNCKNDDSNVFDRLAIPIGMNAVGYYKHSD